MFLSRILPIRRKNIFAPSTSKPARSFGRRRRWARRNRTIRAFYRPPEAWCGGGFAAVDAKAGRTLWHFETNQAWKASPMTYVANGRQYVEIASGGNILSF